MNFIFISPHFPKTYYQFCQELKNNGVNVLGIASDWCGSLSNEVKNSLTEYYQVNNMENYDEDILEEAVVFKNTGRQANRIKCATIGWNGMQELIDLSKK